MTPIKFIDFCAGIGGGRLGLESLGMSCVGFSEIDKDAETTYRTVFGSSEPNFGNLMVINPTVLPDFDLMIGGFPCQTFSIMGDRQGLTDSKGQIIYGLVNILKKKRVKYFILENVKGLINHNGGESLKEILNLFDTSGYSVSYDLLNSLDFGVPQMRERVYFVGIQKELAKGVFKFPKKHEGIPDIKNFLINTDDKFIFNKNSSAYKTFLNYLENKYNKDLYEPIKFLENEYLVLDTRQSDLRLYDKKVPTLRRGRHGILYVKDQQLRKLSGKEALLLQGFPIESVNKVVGLILNSKLLQQAGNAMTVSVISDLAKSLIKQCG